MNKGYIDKDWYGNMVVVHEYKEGSSKYTEEIPIHPCYQNCNELEVGQPIIFQYAKECTIHYPKYCDCYKLKTYALIKPIKNKPSTILERLKSRFRRKIK